MIKLEKTKISTMLHEAKKRSFSKYSQDWELITYLVNKIDNTSAKDKDIIISIYEEFLYSYVGSGLNQNRYKLVGRGLDEVVLLINSKVTHEFLNGKVEEWNKLNLL